MANKMNPNEDNMEDLRVTLELDNDEQLECQILTIFEANNQDYIALLPLDDKGEPNSEGDVYIYRYFEDEEGNPSLENIDSDEEYEIVADRFDELLDEEEFEQM